MSDSGHGKDDSSYNNNNNLINYNIYLILSIINYLVITIIDKTNEGRYT